MRLGRKKITISTYRICDLCIENSKEYIDKVLELVKYFNTRAGYKRIRLKINIKKPIYIPGSDI